MCVCVLLLTSSKRDSYQGYDNTCTYINATPQCHNEHAYQNMGGRQV